MLKKWKDSWKDISEMYFKQFFPEDYINVCNKKVNWIRIQSGP